MLEIRGKYNTAKVFTDNVEAEAISQIMELCNQEFVAESQIRIMPDTHAGAGCTIGTTMTITDKIVPNLVGVDIGCGMETIKLKNSRLDLEKLDHVIHNDVPAGFVTRETVHPYAKQIDFEGLICKKAVNLERAKLSIATLGGGNHFLEVNTDSTGALYLVVHSGSRNLGKQVAEYYQKFAFQELNGQNQQAEEVIKRLKAAGRVQEIEQQLQQIKRVKVRKELAYLVGQSYQDYLHDMQLVQGFATLNRQAIIEVIVKRMGLEIVEQFTTIHNYIDLKGMILRKGAISAHLGERILIPINMRDGSLLCRGKGNPDWNYSAPHGAGRLMSRSKAKDRITLEEFEASMQGIYSTTVNRSTIDECALAYKPMEEIVRNIQETVEILEVLKPIYNFKAAE